MLGYIDMSAYLAIDLGATSGRVSVGVLDEDRLEMQQVHRFPNEPLQADGSLTWDVDRLWQETTVGLTAAVEQVHAGGRSPAGIAVDAWGVDFGLVDPAGELLAPPRHYRSADPAVQHRVEQLVPASELFARTGVQPLVINTLFQLVEVSAGRDLAAGVSLLLVPDLWTFWLSGTRASERTIAGTTQLVDVSTGQWDRQLAAAVGVDHRVLPPIHEPATRAGTLLDELARQLGSHEEVPIFHVASHDTASAVAAIPGGERVAFISCGTWALTGVETDRPVLGEDARREGFTNEPGLDGRTLFLRNLTGLWLLEEAVRAWQRQGVEVSLADLLEQARLPGPVAFVDVGHPDFIAAGDVVMRLQQHCEATGQSIPRTPAAITRCILHSLALAYRSTIDRCEVLTGRTVDRVHMVGGGTHNTLLCQLTADACDRPLLAGPAEAASIGNVLTQALAAGEVTSIDHLRTIVRPLGSTRTYRPRGGAFGDRLYRGGARMVERARTITTDPAVQGPPPPDIESSR